jgi:hypothetical protein
MEWNKKFKKIYVNIRETIDSRELQNTRVYMQNADDDAPAR